MEDEPRNRAEPEEHRAVTPNKHCRYNASLTRMHSRSTLEVCPVLVNNDVNHPDRDPYGGKEEGQGIGRSSSTPDRQSDSEEALSVAQEHHIGPDDFPDGVIKAYTVLLGAWCTLFCTFGVGNSVGVFQAYFTRDGLSNHNSSTVAWVTGLMLWTINFTPIVFGIIYDHFGPKWVILSGTLVYVFGLMMTSLCTELWHFFLAQSIVAAIGAGAGASVGMSTTVSWFYKRRATAFGIIMSLSSVGGIVLPIMMTRLIESIGFSWTIRVLAFMFLGLMGISCVTLRARLPPRPKNFVLTEYFKSLKKPVMVVTVTAMFLFFWGMFLPFNIVILQAEAQGMDPGLVVYLLPIMHSVSILGRIVPGILADKYGRYNVMICVTLLASAFVLGIWIPATNNAAILALVVAFGFCCGAFTSLSPTVIAQISDIREIGTRTGTAFAIQSFGALTGSYC